MTMFTANFRVWMYTRRFAGTFWANCTVARLQAMLLVGMLHGQRHLIFELSLHATSLSLCQLLGLISNPLTLVTCPVRSPPLPTQKGCEREKKGSYPAAPLEDFSCLYHGALRVAIGEQPSLPPTSGVVGRHAAADSEGCEIESSDKGSGVGSDEPRWFVALSDPRAEMGSPCTLSVTMMGMVDVGSACLPPGIRRQVRTVRTRYGCQALILVMQLGMCAFGILVDLYVFGLFVSSMIPFSCQAVNESVTKAQNLIHFDRLNTRRHKC